MTTFIVSARMTTPAEEYFAYVGCFDAALLERRGVDKRPGGAAASSSDPLRCSLGCAPFSYFAVGSEGLVGGSCLCGDLPTITWRRDEEGMVGLKRIALRSLT